MGEIVLEGCTALKKLIQGLKKNKCYGKYTVDMRGNVMVLTYGDAEVYIRYKEFKGKFNSYRVHLKNHYVDNEQNIVKDRVFTFLSLNTACKHLVLFYCELEEFKDHSLKMWKLIKLRNRLIVSVYVKLCYEKIKDVKTVLKLNVFELRKGDVSIQIVVENNKFILLNKSTQKEFNNMYLLVNQLIEMF